jgi:hypothetical protein
LSKACKFVLLNAQPQIGKTGAILSMLDVVEHVFDRSSSRAISALESESSELAKQTELYRKLSAKDFREFAKIFEGAKFKVYHDLRENCAPRPNSIIFEYLKRSDDMKNRAGPHPPIVIADCGCGRTGIWKSFVHDAYDVIPDKRQDWSKTIIYGYDIDGSIMKDDRSHRRDRDPLFVPKVE